MIDAFARRAFVWGRRHPFAALALCLLVGALVSVSLGQDANWDLLNYHLYNAWAWLSGHDVRDLAVAGMQSYFNPLLDVPYYLIVNGPLGAWPRVVAALQGLWYGGLIYTVAAILTLYARLEGREAGLGEALALLIGVSGSAVIAQAGTTFNEVPMAMLVLVAFALLLRAAAQADRSHLAVRRSTARAVLIAGVLAGLAIGLKPTAVVYAPALAAACLVLAPRGSRWRDVLLFGAAGVFGVLVAYGAWGLHLYRMTGNPLFPMFNNIFHSGWVPAVNGTDRRFLPNGIIQWLFYPFEWSVHKRRLVTEVPMRDARLAVVWLAVVFLGASLPWRMRRETAAASGGIRWRAQGAMLLFLGVAYVGWLALFAIYRYLIPVEALSGLAGLLLVRAAFGLGRGRVARRVLMGLCMVVVLALLFGTHRPNWGHTSFAARSVEVQAPALPDHALVLVVGQPNAFVVPFLHGRSTSYVGLTWFTVFARHRELGERTRQRIESHRGPIFAVLRTHVSDYDGPPADEVLRRYGLTLDAQHCAPVRSNLDQDLQLCGVRR